MHKVSVKFSSTMPIRIKRKLTETLPVISGSMTFRRDARIAMARYARNFAGFSIFQVEAPYASVEAPSRYTTDRKIKARRDIRFRGNSPGCPYIRQFFCQMWVAKSVLRIAFA